MGLGGGDEGQQGQGQGQLAGHRAATPRPCYNYPDSQIISVTMDSRESESFYRLHLSDE